MKMSLVAVVVMLAVPTLLPAQQSASGPSLVEQAVQAAQIDRQRTIARVNELLGRAGELIKAHEWIDADTAVRTADRFITGGKALTEEDQATLRAEVMAVAGDLAAQRSAGERQKTEAASKEIAQREVQRRAAEEVFAERQVAGHWARLREFRDQRDYDQAVSEAQAILQKNPNDQKARQATEELSYKSTMAQNVETRISRGNETRASLSETEDAAIPYAAIVRYPSPKAWQELTERRLGQMARDRGLGSSATSGMVQLNARVDLNMDNVSLSNVLTYLGEATHTVIAIDPRLKDDTSKSADDEMVTAHIRGITLEKALQMILPAEMGFRTEDDHLIVSSREKANPLRIASYPVQDMVAEIPDFGSSVPKFDLSSALNQGQSGAGGAGGGGGGAGSGLFPPEGTEEKPEAKTGEKLIAMIKKFVTASDPQVAAWDDAGGTATIEYFNGSLIVNQTDAGHRKVIALLNKF
jgi:hypothetical protein